MKPKIFTSGLHKARPFHSRKKLDPVLKKASETTPVGAIGPYND